MNEEVIYADLFKAYFESVDPHKALKTLTVEGIIFSNSPFLEELWESKEKCEKRRKLLKTIRKNKKDHELIEDQYLNRFLNETIDIYIELSASLLKHYVRYIYEEQYNLLNFHRNKIEEIVENRLTSSGPLTVDWFYEEAFKKIDGFLKFTKQQKSSINAQEFCTEFALRLVKLSNEYFGWNPLSIASSTYNLVLCTEHSTPESLKRLKRSKK